MIPLDTFQHKTIALFGLGKSGEAAALALQAGGAEVWAWDDSAATRAKAAAKNIPLVDLYSCDWSHADSFVLSPGVPHDKPSPHPLAALARQAGCEIIGDIELLARAGLAARFLAITGTNGKSTTTALIGHILSQRRQAGAGGRQHRHPGAGAGEPGCRGILRAGDFLLPTGDHLLSPLRRSNSPQHQPGPPGAPRRHGGLYCRETADLRGPPHRPRP